MEPLKLNLDDLRVESFITTPEVEESKGTVRGFATEQFDCSHLQTHCGPECETNVDECTGQPCFETGDTVNCGNCDPNFTQDPNCTYDVNWQCYTQHWMCDNSYYPPWCNTSECTAFC